MTRPAPSADLLARLARRFRGSPGHAAWVARQVARHDESVRPGPRGGHTELLLDRFAREDAKAMGGELPAVWSAYS